MNDLVWQIPLGLLALATVFRILAAPYWLWRAEREKKGQ
jgi:hypothetical protein